VGSCDNIEDVGRGSQALIWRNDEMIRLFGIRISLGKRGRSGMVTNSTSADVMFNEVTFNSCVSLPPF
jgi:hypothetical protein